MFKKSKIKMCVAVMALLMLTSSISAFAQTYRNVYVYGASYKVVADGTTDNTGNFVTVTVINIKKSDGSASSYSKVRADVIDGDGDQISTDTNVPLTVQQAETIYLKQIYWSGAYMKLRMKGNNNNLDCIVDFSASITQ